MIYIYSYFHAQIVYQGNIKLEISLHHRLKYCWAETKDEIGAQEGNIANRLE